ncbi:MAG TPA: hypothetical protein VHO24_10975, partial [Opitutaceae bacterium]|nr:hypothetical protein [Opitutaceae bacterium]
MPSLPRVENRGQPKLLFVAIALFSIAATVSATAEGLPGFFSTREPDVLTVTDVTPEGRSWPEPDPARPVYYEAMSFGAKNFRGLPGDNEPQSKAML